MNQQTWPPTGVRWDVPGSHDLRLAADWSSAVRGRPLYFRYAKGELSITQPGEGWGLRTVDVVQRPTVTQVEFSVPGAGKVWLSGGECSAVLWGESSVEKFLFPYYASAAGAEAPEVLAQIADVWYRFPPAVPVCALGFGFGGAPPAGPLTLHATVIVVFIDPATGRLGKLPMPEFLATYGTCPWPPRQPPMEGPLPVEAPARPLTSFAEAYMVRSAAEYVSGLRSDLMRFSSPDGWSLEGAPASVPSGPMPPAFFYAQSWVLRERPAPDQVTLWRDNEFPSALMDPASTAPDSVFFSDGSVEKLVLPYYSSVNGWPAPLLNAVLLAEWAGFDLTYGDPALLLAELGALTMSFGLPVMELEGYLRGVGETPSPVPKSPPSDVFAITHLPQSEYSSIGDQPVAVDNRLVLCAGHGGETFMYTLRQGRRSVRDRRAARGGEEQAGRERGDPAPDTDAAPAAAPRMSSALAWLGNGHPAGS